MIKKFFVAITLGLLLINSQITLAADYNWNTVKRVGSKTEFADYMKNQQKAGQTVIPVVLINGLVISNSDFLTLCPTSVVSQEIVYNDGQISGVIYRLMDYPSTKVLNAYRSGNTDWLNAEEKQLYNVAVKIVNEAKKYDNLLKRESFIYYAILNRVDYYSENNMSNQPHFVTAYGALVEGRANCQGYADAFYLLGNMLGFNVGRMSGTAGGVPHQWNTIELNGKIYCVDVTWSEETDVYLNAPKEIMAITHQWDITSEPANFQPSVDEFYSYNNPYNMMGNSHRRFNNAEAGLKFLAQKMGKDKSPYDSVMVPYDERYVDADNVTSYFRSEFDKTGCRGSDILLGIKTFGKYLFITAHGFHDLVTKDGKPMNVFSVIKNGKAVKVVFVE